MESSSSKTSPTVRSPFASPSTGFLLRKRILAWTLETGSPASVCVRVDGKLFNLHKSPLVSKCGYFKRALLESSEVELPETFPGGLETFETVALFVYNHPPLLDPFNITALRCAAELLEMTEDHEPGNLRERSDLYLNQVVLQSWDDTLIVLQKCKAMVPWSEELLIVSRCVESLAFMACMEILDPEQTRDRELWIKDLIALPFEFFKRIIGSLRRQGMKEKYVSPLVVFYANKWVLSKKTHKFWENMSDDANNKVSAILQGVLDLLPDGEGDGGVIPVSFYFALLSRSLGLGLSNLNVVKLQERVAALLHRAQVVDFLLPEGGLDSIASTPELRTMESIISIRVSSKIDKELCCSSIVAELWDRYLAIIAADRKLEPGRFIELTGAIPMNDRETHDHLYRALNSFLSEHPHLSTEEKAALCKYLNCQKLSQEACIEAVQNEQMPLRLIVQALFAQQLHTHQAFKSCSDSFRYTHIGEFSGSITSPYKQATPLGSLLQKEVPSQRSELTKEDYESASFRLQALEEELTTLKQSLQRQKSTTKEEGFMGAKAPSFRLFGLEGRTVVKKRKPVGQGGSCIGSLSWASQRKYANRLLKVLGRITILGKGRSKIKHGASASDSLNGSLGCRSKSLHEMYDC